MNNLLFILGIIALSNGNISLDDNIKDNTIDEQFLKNMNEKDPIFPDINYMIYY